MFDVKIEETRPAIDATRVALPIHEEQKTRTSVISKKAGSLFFEDFDKFKREVDELPAGSIFSKNPKEGLSLMDAMNYDRAIEINPKYVEAYYNRTMMYNRLGENDKALSDHLKAIEVSPRPLDKGSTDMFASIGNIYYSKEEFAKAIDYYTQGIEVDPTMESYIMAED